MKGLKTMRKSFIFFGVLLLAFTQVAEAAVAGRFQFVNGDVKVVATNGKERSASKGSEVSEGESVVTSPSASAQIKMVDDGLIVVRPDTKLRITTFLYSGKTDGSERSFISLFRGGFRAITGAIGRVNKDNYKIETPTATIGIRGTDHEPTFIPNPAPGQVAIAEPGTYDKVNSGAAVLSTANGMIVIKPDQAGFVPNIGNAAPKILATIPAFLRTAPSKDEPKIVPKAGADLKEGGKANANQPIGMKERTNPLQSSTAKESATPLGSSTAKGGVTPLATGGAGATLGTAKMLDGAGATSPSTTLKSGAILTDKGAAAPIATKPTATISPVISTSKTLTTSTIAPVISTTNPKVTSPALINNITPTVKPEVAPTVKVLTTTITPTIKPTVTPTIAPSVAPVVSPTVKVLPTTVAPVVAPAVTPTIKPTVLPTIAPTVAPVVAPSVKVVPITIAPVVAPTITPTVTPTIAPTVAPVVAPIVKVVPTVITPVVAPTITPTVTTVAPVVAPTTITPTVTSTVTPLIAPTTVKPITTTIQPITTFSDRRLKTNIKRVGTHPLGIGIYEFDYVWGEHATGVMADEVKTVMPEAVTRHPSGYDVVDYSKLQ